MARRRRKHKHPASDSEYNRRRRKRPTKADGEGCLYVIKGRLRKKTFYKVGRSNNPFRRFEEHLRSCRAVTGWEVIGIWLAKHHHKTESCVLSKLENSSFEIFEETCPCGINHEERLRHPRMTMAKASDLIEMIVSAHVDI
ncbi:hypothetical protein V5O48_018593 [Marasmius crinis-equi]|uniref:Bacteriophage T5 Orf172 DNA-binding domain-containing protein n=1 Tax=Marasmius crinis-equi TaxID=585013 RepID=A0ABR3EKS4_9AGAR